MKKLALAPAVAIAITGLAASPVIAAPGSLSYSHADVQSSGTAEEGTTPESPDAEAQAIEATVKTSPKEITAEDLANKDKGIVVSISGLEAGDKVEDSLSGVAEESAEGESLEYNIYAKAKPEEIETGEVKFSVTITRDGEKRTYDGQSFTVVEDEPEAPATDPKVTLKKDKLTESEFAKNGVTVSGEGFTPNGKVTVIGAATQSPFATLEVTADKDGKIPETVVEYDGDDTLPPAKYGVYALDQETKTQTDFQSFTITKDETEDPTTPAAEAKLTVSPETISPADFVKEDKGVTLAVENCEPGEDVRFLVNPKGNSNVTAFDKTIKADDEGKANVNVFGTSASNPSAYIGDYDVTVTCGDAELTGEFSVEKDPNAGGNDGDDNGNDNGDNGNGGSDLPRTGADLTGLVGGAGLLLIGGVAVALTTRRKKTAKDPAEI